MIMLKKILALTRKNSQNVGVYWMMEILLILYNNHVIFKNQDNFMFYVNNYIDRDEFNPFYNCDRME